MPGTYPAILHGDRLEWLASPPQARDGARVDVVVAVEVDGVVDEVRPSGVTGRDLGSLLDRLTGSPPFGGMDDPAEWQRREREDRDLPA